MVLDRAELLGAQVGVADDAAVGGDEGDAGAEDPPDRVGLGVELDLGRRGVVREHLGGHARFEPELALDPLLQAPPHRPRDQRRRHRHRQRRRRERREEDLRRKVRSMPVGMVFQPVPELLDRHDGVGEEGQLLAEAPDVHVDRPGAAGVLVAPHVGQQQVAREHAAAMLDEVLKQQELLRRQLHVLAVHLDGVPIGVDGQRPVAQRRRPAGCALDPAEQRGDAGGQLARAERLGDVVVGAQLESRDPLGLFAPRREHDDRDQRRRRIAAQRLADEEAVHARAASDREG